jgi:hypothetical protein
MVTRGDLNEEQCQLIRSRAVTGGQSFAEVLVSEGTISASELYKILQQNLGKKLLDGFTWLDGEFSILAEAPPVESPLRVRTPQLIITGITKLVPDEEIEKALAPLEAKKLCLNPAPPYPREDVRLAGEHQLVLEILSEAKGLDEIVEDTKKPREKVLRMLYALTVIGLIVPDEWRAPEPVVATPDMDFMLPTPEPVQEHVSTVPLATDATMVYAGEFRDRVMDLYLKYRKLDAFELLGLTDDASMDDIEQKYVEFSEKYAPWKYRQPEHADLSDKVRELFIAGGKALGELNDPESRNSLIARRQNKLVTRTMEFSRDQFRITTDLLDSETQFKKGKELMDAEKYPEAVKQLQFAHDCDPQNPIYRAELAYCRYLHQPEAQGDGALQELNEALRIDPQCGLAAYYAGVIHSDQANFLEAEAYLQNAIKMLGPDDRRPVQALKALEGLKK